MMFVLFFNSGVCGLWAAIGIFVFFCVCASIAIPKGKYTFEREGQGSFEPSLERYFRLTEFIVGLATGTIVLLTGTSIFHSSGRLPQPYGSPMMLVAMSIVWLILFVSCTTFFYEDSKYHPENYTHIRYRLIQAFGFSGLLCFALGYVWLCFALVHV